MSTTNPQLHYTDSGGEQLAIVFLHYFGGSERTWQPIIQTLKNEYRCVAIDLWGFGSSPDPQREIGVADSAGKVLEVIQYLQLPKFVLVGHSMGGKIALSVAATQPTGLQQLILIAPSPPVPEPLPDDKRKELLDIFGDSGALEKSISKITAHPLPEQTFDNALADHLRISKHGWDAWLTKGSKEDISGSMNQSQIPIHVIHGAADPNFTMDFLRKIYNRYFKNVNYTELPDVGHIVPLEAPESLAKIFKNLLATDKTSG